MNMAAYANKLPVSCVPDPSDVTISKVVLAKQVIGGKVKVSLISFQITCEDGTTATIDNN